MLKKIFIKNRIDSIKKDLIQIKNEVFFNINFKLFF